MADIKLENIQQACLDGIVKSFNEYQDWAGERLWNAPEYLLTVNIAKKLWKNNGKKFITLEDKIEETLKIAKSKSSKNRNSTKMRANGKADIIVWSYKNGRPKGIIEVKNYTPRLGKIQKDIDRIIEMLKEDSKIEFGISTFFIDDDCKVNAKENLQKRIDKIYCDLQEYVFPFKVEYHYQEVLTELIRNNLEEYSSFAVVFTIKKKIK